jgi:hypothetical protein
VQRNTQTIEAREGFNNRTLQDIRSGAQFVQTSFPDASSLPGYAYSVKGTSNFTLFATNYTVRPLPPSLPPPRARLELLNIASAKLLDVSSVRHACSAWEPHVHCAPNKQQAQTSWVDRIMLCWLLETSSSPPPEIF